MNAIRLRKIVNLDDGTTWGHRANVNEPAEMGIASAVAAGATGADVVAMASQIVDELNAVSTIQTSDDGAIAPRSEAQRVVVNLPHRFWSDHDAVTRICQLLWASVPGIFLSVELNVSLATAAELTTASQLRRGGIATVVLTNTVPDHNRDSIKAVGPTAFFLSPHILTQINNEEFTRAEVMFSLATARHVGVTPIACDLESTAQAAQLLALGCQLGFYREIEPH
jgi:hypothetical protein